MDTRINILLCKDHKNSGNNYNHNRSQTNNFKNKMYNKIWSTKNIKIKIRGIMEKILEKKQKLFNKMKTINQI